MADVGSNKYHGREVKMEDLLVTRAWCGGPSHQHLLHTPLPLPHKPPSNPPALLPSFLSAPPYTNSLPTVFLPHGLPLYFCARNRASMTPMPSQKTARASAKGRKRDMARVVWAPYALPCSRRYTLRLTVGRVWCLDECGVSLVVRG